MSVQLLSCNLLPLTIYAIIQSYKCSIYGSRDVPTDWTGNLTTLYKIGQWSHIDEFYRFYLRHSKLPLQCSEKYFNNSECKLGKNCRVLLLPTTYLPSAQILFPQKNGCFSLNLFDVAFYHFHPAYPVVPLIWGHQSSLLPKAWSSQQLIFLTAPVINDNNSIR